MNTNYEIHNEEIKAKELFAPKPFAIEYLPLKRLANILHPLLSVVSIITGISFVYYRMVGSLPIWLSWLLASFLLISLEILKKIIGEFAFKKTLIGNNIVGNVMMSVTAILIGASVYTSVNGADELIHNTSERKAVIFKKYQSELDSVNKHYNAIVQNEYQSLDVFKKSVSWKGIIDIQNKAVQSTIQHHTDNIDALQNERLKIVEILTKDNVFALQQASTKTNLDATVWLFISGAVELMLLACIWFPIWYSFGVYKEDIRNEFERGNNNDKSGIIVELLDRIRGGETRYNVLSAEFGVNPQTIKYHKSLLK